VTPCEARVEADDEEREDEADEQREQRPFGVVEHVPGDGDEEQGHVSFIIGVRGREESSLPEGEV
jgi:hypothetical protein